MVVHEDPPDATQERRRRRHDKTRRDILRAARAVMLESGADGITMREVARRADFSPAALYKYYSGRDALLAALTRESFLMLKACIDEVPRSLPPDRRLVALAMAYLRFADENPADLLCILDSTTRPLPPAVDLSVGLAAVQALRETLAEGMQRGVLRELTPRQLATTAYGLWALVHGLTTLRGVDLGPVKTQIRPDAKRAVQTYVDGLRPAGR